MEDNEKVKSLILRELIKKCKFGGAHAPLDFITGNLPDEFLHNKQGQKAIQKAVKDLINDEWVVVLMKKTGKGSDLHVSVNPRKIREISEYVQSGKNS
ncbi:Uncharacterised protein [uncultured archaeon]|nr:Uncharacterised protein [uncultured archaeon]